MQQQIPSVFLSRSAGGAGALALALAALTPGCSREATAPEAPAQAEAPPQPGPASDPMSIFNSPQPPAPREFTQPVLGFEARDQGLPISGTWIGYPLLHDFTGDGRADLVASNREEDGYSAWESAEDGTWKLRIAGPPGEDGEGPGLARDMQYGPAEAADMNGDGIVDLVLSAHTDALRVYLNDGQMRWTRAPAPIENVFLILDVATGNLDGDAFPDVAAVAHFEGGAALFLNDGQGGLKRLPESTAILPSRAMGKDVELMDLDGDGTDDLVMGCDKGLKAILVKKGDPYRFTDISAGLPVPTIGNTIYSVHVGQFVSGGWPEIAFCAVANPLDLPEKRDYVGVFGWDPAAKQWRHIDAGLPREEAYRDLVAGDFNRDGHLDLLTISIESAAVVWLGSGDGKFRAVGRLEGNYNKGRSTLGDVDGDGWLDVVVAIPAQKNNPEAGRLRCYRNRPEIWR